MQELTVIGVENGALVVASDAGERFRIVIDDVLQSRMRQSLASAAGGRKVSPREIQTHIRAGLSASEVAELTGAALEYVERFEGPVLAERQFMVDSALRVPVQPTGPADPLGEEPLSTFGEAIEGRLESLSATDVRWASWKDEEGWTVKLTFTASQIDHDARWQFDPKRHSLSPLNSEATTLSRHGELTEGLIPRLRAVGPDVADEGRFDSGAFEPSDSAGPQVTVEIMPERVQPEPAQPSAQVRTLRPESSRAVDAAAVNRAPDTADTNDHNQTADLLEALRRRRGERASAPIEPEQDDERPLVDPAPLTRPEEIDTPLAGLEAEIVTTGKPSTPQKTGPVKRQRASMPTWDEIVFGARSEDDPA
ncbi:septation protein SepH [Cnuibacter sp. UC19_7]|uniref:septation protein SepH n=1 Tax=Cnuibacter sp. UC19_7 TaxID=3350166 RepID=UPI0036701618